MICKTLRISFLSSLLLFFVFSLVAAPSADDGKVLFRNYCASCHAKNMKSALTGPALGGAEERWADYPREDLYAWIRNSQAMIATGHPRAVELWNEYKPTVMTAWPDLTDEEIESILLYVNGMYDGTYGVAAGAAAGPVAQTEAVKESNGWLYGILLALMAGLAIFLARVIGNMDRLVAHKEGTEYEGKTLAQTLTSKGIVTFAIFALIVLAGYTTVNRAVNLGRQQTYAPEQPINFSHKTHAGLHKIDCQYCHDGARRSKHAVIPATNTCMNCHKAIKVGSKHGTSELSKIYASIGYDPIKNTYVDEEEYANMSQDDIKTMYVKWITEQYLVSNEIEALDAEGERIVEEQWKGILSSLTNEQKNKVQGPIEWTRIHNLPDHVYFNHSQHVAVGGVECQTCHGKVEEMDVVAQHAPLSMGWCINCHRESEVKFDGNEYYKSYENYHNELASGDREKVTVEDIGGLECQKCHY
jgi:mono/diheme cytochrome c family protein